MIREILILWKICGVKKKWSLSPKVMRDDENYSSLDTSLRNLTEEVICSTILHSSANVYTNVDSSLRDLVCDSESSLGEFDSL